MPWMGTLSRIDWKAVAELVGSAVALVTLIKGTMEYLKQGAQMRADLYLRMSDKFDSFRDICTLLDNPMDAASSTGLSSLAFDRKREFLGFYEELSLMTRSGLMKPAVVHYMFGYYAIRCWESEGFWNPGGPSRKSQYWAIFASFVQQMKHEERRFLGRKLRVRKYRL